MEVKPEGNGDVTIIVDDSLSGDLMMKCYEIYEMATDSASDIHFAHMLYDEYGLMPEEIKKIVRAKPKNLEKVVTEIWS